MRMSADLLAERKHRTDLELSKTSYQRLQQSDCLLVIADNLSCHIKFSVQVLSVRQRDRMELLTGYIILAHGSRVPKRRF